MKHSSYVASVAFSPVNRRIILSGAGSTLHIWDIESGSLVCDTLEGHLDTVSSISFSPGGEYIASGSYDGTIYVWSSERDAVVLWNDGWIVGPEARLLLWIPMMYRDRLWFPWNTMVFPRDYIELNLSEMAHGGSWQECYNGSGKE
ncbi:hypothetical protein ID866_11493 [Astraeus odoratus]|nr:hypothetical protein ID866_11493 [Astraeus odoratus]